tara:strand:- start:1323 stop:2033 length:711 start_codon:yes stop_codon:yes gene_type:complete
MSFKYNTPAGRYDLIHIQKEVKKDFKFVLENDKKYDNIRRNRIYKKGLTKFINNILNLYKPDDNLFIIDNTINNCYFSLMSAIQNYKCIYVNKNKEYNHYVDMNRCVNHYQYNNINQNLLVLNKPRDINTIFTNNKKRYVLIKIVNHSDEIFNTTRLINTEKLPHIIILRDTYKKDNPETYRQLTLKCYNFYKITNTHDPIKINNIYEFIKKKNKISIACVHHHSKFRDSLTVYFD